MRIVETIGHKFDAHLHEVATHEHTPRLVIEQVKGGYTLGDRVLRLAQVKVAVAVNHR